MLSMDVSDIPILSAAEERGLGESNLEDILIGGDYRVIPELPDFQLPKRFRSTKARNYKALVKVIDFLKTRPKINLKECEHCNTCVESCPVEAINKETKLINYNDCIECMCCHELCMHQAVDLKKENFIARIFTKFYRGKYR